MALSTYTGITAALLQQTEVAVTAQIDDLFRQAEARIFRKLRIRPMEMDLSVTMSSGVAALPADHIEVDSAYILFNGQSYDMTRRDREWITRRYKIRSTQARPRFWARKASNLIFGPFPDQDYLVNGVYYARLSSLVSTSSNWFTTNAPDLLMAAGKCEIYGSIEQFDKAEAWKNQFLFLADEVQKEDDREKRMGSRTTAIPDMAYR